jgi:hypothetical protein
MIKYHVVKLIGIAAQLLYNLRKLLNFKKNV